MGGFFKKVAGAFVELDQSSASTDPVSPDELNAEAAALLAEIEAGAESSAAPEPPPPPPAPPAGDGRVEVGVPFDQLYARASVPTSPYTAEMLLRVAEGLKALPPAQALAAVEAMDAADDRWTVGDVLLDADRKMEALRAARKAVDAAVAGARSVHESTTRTIDEHLARTEETVRTQIAELEQIRKEARDVATTERAAALSEMEATRQAAAAEVDRLDVEIRRLGEVHDFLGEPSAAPDAPAAG